MELVIVALLSVHLMLVDLAMAGPLAALWLESGGSRSGSEKRVAIARTMLRWSATSLAIAIVLGGVLLTLFWYSDRYENYFDAISKVPRSRLWSGLGELVFYYLCLGAHAFWLRRPPIGKPLRYFMRLLPVMAATDLMFHFPPLFAVISVLAGRPSQRGAIETVLGRGDYYSLLIDAEVLSRVVHVWIAAVAVTGVAVMIASRQIASEADEGTVVIGGEASIAVIGARWSLLATLLQVPVGLWLAFSMSEDARTAVFGGDVVATALFGISLLLTLQLLHSLASISLGEASARSIWKVAIVMFAIVLAMVGVLYRANRQHTFGNLRASVPEELVPIHDARDNHTA